MGLAYCRSLTNGQTDILVITIIHYSHHSAWRTVSAKQMLSPGVFGNSPFGKEGHQGTLLCWALAGRMRCAEGVMFWLEAGSHADLPSSTPLQ